MADDIFSRVRRASFGGIEFPYTDYSITGSLRHHVHEYIKRPGGEVENLKRRAYEFSFRCPFRDVFEGYVDLYPSVLSALISLCEAGDTKDLWVPTMGRSFPCKATTWVRNVSAAMRSGEDVTFSFIEDSTEAFTTLNLIGAKSAALGPKSKVLTNQIAVLEDATALGLLDKVLLELEKWQSAIDLAQAQVEYQTARIDALVQSCEALAAVPVLQLPVAAPALRTLIDMWATAIAERQAQRLAFAPIQTFVVDEQTTDVVAVTMKLYGSPKRVGEVLRFNDFDDALRITRGTRVRYLAA